MLQCLLNVEYWCIRTLHPGLLKGHLLVREEVNLRSFWRKSDVSLCNYKETKVVVNKGRNIFCRCPIGSYNGVSRVSWLMNFGKKKKVDCFCMMGK